MLWAVKLTKNADFDKYKYSGYGTGFDARGNFSSSCGSGFDKNVIIFGPDISSFVHVDSRRSYISILGKGPTQGLDDTTLTAEKEYAINYSEQQKKFCSILHYNGVNNYLFVNIVEIMWNNLVV